MLGHSNIINLSSADRLTTFGSCARALVSVAPIASQLSLDRWFFLVITIIPIRLPLIALVSNDRGRQRWSDTAIWLKTWILNWYYNASQLLRNRFLVVEITSIILAALLDIISLHVFSVHHLLWVSKWLATRGMRGAYTEKSVIAIDANFRD